MISNNIIVLSHSYSFFLIILDSYSSKTINYTYLNYDQSLAVISYDNTKENRYLKNGIKLNTILICLMYILRYFILFVF